MNAVASCWMPCATSIARPWKGNRHKLLLQYLKGLDRYYPALESDIIQTDLTSAPRTRQLAMLGEALFEAVFVAFKLTLTERLAKRGLLEREQQRIELLLYTMMAARQLLSICCQSYSPRQPISGTTVTSCTALHWDAAGRTSIWKKTILPQPFTGKSCYC
jgi:hypothetical protein